MLPLNIVPNSLFDVIDPLMTKKHDLGFFKNSLLHQHARQNEFDPWGLELWAIKKKKI